ncbi:hypothetical protein ACFQZ8_07520 [Micromonospora azadirachtae]|uniref:4Fe-4S ferredoxin-type domain-containing protein n=1 Tax=Micromonospora azadirachtae TaxID=1970735 RepID=A0ABW2ZYN8_9ACTN
MIKLLRRRRANRLPRLTLCESCGQVCTAACRADAHYERGRTAALTDAFVR